MRSLFLFMFVTRSARRALCFTKQDAVGSVSLFQDHLRKLSYPKFLPFRFEICILHSASSWCHLSGVLLTVCETWGLSHPTWNYRHALQMINTQNFQGSFSHTYNWDMQWQLRGNRFRTTDWQKCREEHWNGFHDCNVSGESCLTCQLQTDW